MLSLYAKWKKRDVCVTSFENFLLFGRCNVCVSSFEKIVIAGYV